MSVRARLRCLTLVAICLASAGILTYELAQPDMSVEVPKVSGSVSLPLVPVASEFDPPPADLLVELVERPLFNPSRQPVPMANEKEEVPPPPPPPPEVLFIGTISQA